GFPRAAVIRRTGDEIAVLAETGETGRDSEPFSRTLLDAAAGGQVARLSHDAPVMHGESIARLGIQAALCSPIFVGSAIDAYLYLEDKRKSADVRPDAAAFCQALCRIGGLALANRRRAALERINADIMRDVGAAAEAQRLLMPRPDGVCAGLRYSVRMRPGRFVAGDLFNILPLEGGRVGVYLGDVAGKGVGAAILMAAMQTMLNSALRSTSGPAEALHHVGIDIAPMLPGGRFISLWVALIEADGLVRFVDAGHGHWLLRDQPGSEPRRAVAVGGMPVGVDPDARYREETIRLEPGGRIILLSDGVLEQRSREGEEFGLGRTITTLLDCATTRDDVEQLFGAVARHAPSESLDDDVTIASIERMKAEG
ncbi:MAG TPA: PP2C family protein-serine/threonine phosphatase, partial [Phycisphaerales bacterium]|nr:PP2C family protein-serine/threonine phosphatase [Phycisphaerales bacterium]